MRTYNSRMKRVFKAIVNYISKNLHYVIAFFIIFYVVGFMGLSCKSTQGLFLTLFPFALILSFSVILIFHQATFDKRTICVFLIIGIAGFIIELAGVQTHLLFGNYRYGNSLGFKVLDTPLLIAVNWVMLGYAGSSIAENLKMPVPIKIIVASLIMVMYDIVLEQIAPLLDMWYWENNAVPLQNYITWFIVSLIFQTLIRVCGIKTYNPIAAILIIIQALFFLSLILLFTLIK